MRKVWKIFISLVLFLLVGGAGTAFYFLEVKSYEVADKAVEEITETEYDIILPDENGSVEIEEKMEGANDSSEKTEANIQDNEIQTSSTKDGSTVNSSTPGQASSTQASQKSTSAVAVSGKTDDSSTADASSTSVGKQSANAKEPQSKQEKSRTNKPEEITVASIKQKYYPSFEYLQLQANEKINSLVSQAYGEYTDKKTNGESISISYFYQKYSTASSELENNTDAAFNIIYSALQNDLKKNGFSPSHADSFKSEYESAKKTRETALLNKVKEAL